MTKPGAHVRPTILGQLSGAHQSGDSEAVSGADRETPSASGHAAGAAVQASRRSVGVAVVLAGGGQRQVAVHLLHALAVTLRGQSFVTFGVSSPDVAERGGIFSQVATSRRRCGFLSSQQFIS